MTLRDYQQKALDQVELGKKHIIYNGIRSGKSVVLWAITQKFKDAKILILTSNRKILLQLKEYYGDEASFILSGKDYDHSKRIFIGSYQTLKNRPEVDIESFDICMRDEAHRYHNNTLVKKIHSTVPTCVDFSGSPIDSRGNILKGYDTWIRTIRTKEMFDRGFLSPVKFFASQNFIEGAEKLLKTNKHDYDEQVVEQLMDNSAILKSVKDRILEKGYHLNNKVLMYVSSISMGEKTLNYLDLPNTRLIHSKLGNGAVEECLEWFKNTSSGILINVKMLSEGYDENTIDGVICLSPTKIRSLFIQRNLRQATFKEGKVGFYEDYVGNLSRFSPFDDDFTTSRKTCKEQCEGFTDAFEKWACLESCKSEPPMTNCNGELSYDLQQNPHISNYRIHEGTPCTEMVPVHLIKYQTVDIGHGRLQKYTRCVCGCLTSYTLKTMMEPSEMIEVYQDEVVRATATVLYDRTKKRAVVLLDDPTQTKYKVLEFTSSEDMYKSALKYFKNKSFQMIANIAMPKLVNVKVNKALDVFVPLINWENQTQNGIVKKIIKFLLEEHIKVVGLKKGFAYYFLKGVTPNVEKEVMEFLNEEFLTKSQLIKMNNKLNPKE